MKDQVLDAVRNNQVIVISGETGCGKTTQVSLNELFVFSLLVSSHTFKVPQLILDDVISHSVGGFCNIICTQPRRISAIAVAERVADERAENIGKTVGWQIRLVRDNLLLVSRWS